MNKLLFTLILHRPKPKPDQGFSLFEVTIAILVSSAFLMGTLQAMTINAVMRVKSERQAQANFLIQQDIEKLQATASNMDLDYIETSSVLNPDGDDRSALCYPFSLNMEDVRFGAYLVRELDSVLANDSNPDTKSDPAINSNTVFSSASTFKQFKTDADGNVLYTNKTPVLDEQEDSVAGTAKTAVVQIVRDQNTLINKDYRLVRIMTVDSATSHQVLQVYYRVGEPYDPTDPNQTDNDNDKLRDDQSDRKSIIAENYTEVIPAAVAECGFSP
ncbi:hypothetical protein [Cyanothece sp. BG0011]|uniref:type IV pilus modification PilV family protein n=1 Tax=Cyanothece sp. BG0011 TaxID=2082950 RepID=UPI000D1DE922|nr:hypothetical protein [Cyanothece sp. BG0011]